MIRVLVKGQPVAFTIDRSDPNDHKVVIDPSVTGYTPDDVQVERVSDDPRRKAREPRPALSLKRSLLTASVTVGLMGLKKA